MWKTVTRGLHSLILEDTSLVSRAFEGQHRWLGGCLTALQDTVGLRKEIFAGNAKQTRRLATGETLWGVVRIDSD